MKPGACVYLRIVLTACCVVCCATFNLEARIPIIKRGAIDSYFGYSVAEHQVINEATGVIEENWILVGAPQGENLQPGTNRSGALFKCPISTRSDDCEQVVTDGKRNSDGQYDSSIDSTDLFPPLKDEIKDGQWLGVTVRSQGPGGKVMVCAHRYMKNGTDYQWGQGLCYTLSQYLDYDNSWDPCKGRPTNKAHEQFGYCQAGTSGLLLEDDTAVIGTPGPYTWRGTIFVMNISDDFLNRDKTFYFAPLQDSGDKDEMSPVAKYSYLGMSVAAGKFFGDKMCYAAGAPRSDGTGQVLIFSKRQQFVNPMALRLILNGEQFASSFGYEVAAADVDGDKRADLIVGAPFYFFKEDGGRVYVYTNLREDCEDCNKPVTLTGQLESRFGFAITNLGDINKDGFDDIAVGAPYDGNGAVFVYLGSEKGIITEPAQVLRAESLPSNVLPMRTFGYSLSGGLDLDQNGYPDLLIGAYEQDSIVLLRSRPIIDIVTTVEPERNLRSIDPNHLGCKRYPDANNTCFTFRTCCTIKSLVKNFSRGTQSVTLNYAIEAETFNNRKKFSRVYFAPGSSKKSNVKKRQIVLKPDLSHKGDLRHCEEETVFIKENTRDIQSPISFRLAYTLVQREPRQAEEGQPLPTIDSFPILNQQEASKVIHATFQKDCGDNDICESELVVDARPVLTQRESGAWDLTLGRDQEMKLDIQVNNYRESAYEAQLFISHPASLSYIGHKTENKKLICRPYNSTLVSCSLGNPFKRDMPAKLTVRFDPRGLDDIESLLEFRVFANSTSTEVNPQDPLKLHIAVIRKAELSIRGLVQPDHMFYSGPVVGESAIRYHDEVGSRVLHLYKVYNEGPWRVAQVDVLVDWPIQVANDKPQGKWLLYLIEPPSVEAIGGGQCYMEPEQVNPLGLVQRPGVDETPLEALIMISDNEANASASTRRKRDTEMVIRAELQTDKDGRQRQIVTMSCSQGSAKCIRFRCSVRNLQMKQEAVIKIRSRLWNSTLVEDYPKVDSVRIRSRARIELPESPAIHQNTADDEAEAETEAFPDKLEQQEAESVPVWIIIVAIVAGLLLLILLTLVLWKLGFFKRRRPDPTLSGNLEKHREENGDYAS
ncbi:integrin alpha-PS1 isoform X1 [Schistocerca gregaria]|uniref:integrin alpha-PS1 isoform X1 n=1 Tax=Schistocerca gregaria TaxID=7010 RepID=UPI00211ECEE1|nr:integrin alpha-PS1 isoform X1 [Schistocerca gregaria]